MSVPPIERLQVATILESIGALRCSACNGKYTTHLKVRTMKRLYDGASTLSDERTVCLTCLLRILKHDTVAIAKTSVQLKDVLDPKRAKQIKRQIMKTSRKREEDIAEQIGGRRVSGSGSGIDKGDARNEKWMVEDKFRKQLTFNVNRRLLQKAKEQAIKSGRAPVIRIGLSDGTEVAVLAWKDFVNEIIEDNS